MRTRWWTGPGFAAAAVVVLAACCAGSPASPPANPDATPVVYQGHGGSGSVSIKTMGTSKGTVLATAAGLTLYWFAKDTARRSDCTGSCASYWPPLMGSATAAAGTSLPRGFGTIKRADGKTQITYDGHPLYTYTGDRSAGQITGNDLDASGGLWWAITPSGSELKAGKAARAAPSASASSSSGTGGW
jgi:predicted lipoprotein with Yx(FWY)xxD motif